MNPYRPLFADVRMRKAVNYAVDRTTLSALGVPSGEALRVPTDQYLPPGMPGYRAAKLFPDKPDLARARALAGSGRHHAVFYNCDTPRCPAIGQALKTELHAIGIELEIKTFGSNEFYRRIGNPREPYDLAFAGWFADYPDPADFLDILLVHAEESHLGPNLREPALFARLKAAAKLTGQRRLLTYGVLANEIARDAAPWAAIGNGVSQNLFSGRVGCQLNQPIYGIDLGALCPRTRKS
jgi:ABC-type oligopeptide transport system substrate-binding subunit